MADHDERMSLDVTGSQIKKFKLGDKVTVTVTGEIFELTAKNPYEPFEDEDGNKEDIPPSVRIKFSEPVDIKKATGSFSDVSGDADDD